MRTLIWKEWRERRLWALALAASTAGVVVFRQGYTFWLSDGPERLLILASVIIALLMRTTVYSGELGRDVADFVLSRPVSWKKLLLSKLIVAFGIVLFAAILAAITFRIVCPEQYVRFLTLGFWAKGIGIALLAMGIPYLFGAACSVVLPGTIGAVLTVLTVLLGLGAEFFLVMSINPWQTSFWVLIACFAGTMLGAALVLRFGLTLPLGRRAGKFALVVALAVICISPLRFFAWPDGQSGHREGWVQHRNWFSPDGEYALLVTLRGSYDVGEGQTVSMAKIAGGKVVSMTTIEMNTPFDGLDMQWAANDMAFWRDYYTRPGNYRIRTAEMLPSGKVMQSQIQLRQVDSPGQSFLSPDRRILAIMFRSSISARYNDRLQFVDIIRKRVIGKPVEVSGATFPFWKSNTELMWVGNKVGIRHSDQRRFAVSILPGNNVSDVYPLR